jgi:4'-phosphopantetheinyl transferase
VSVDTVHVWLVRADLPDPVLAELEVLLDDEERERAGGMADPGARRRFVATRGVARTILAERLGAAPEQLRWQRGAHGKPELAGHWQGAQVSLSHSGELAMVAVTGRRPVGVDIQRRSDRLDARALATRYFPGPEARFVAAAGGPARQLDRLLRLWVRKEACVKAAGGRLVQGMRLPVAGGGPGVVVRDPTGTLPDPFLIRDLPVPAGFRAAVALTGAAPYRVARHRWGSPR